MPLFLRLSLSNKSSFFGTFNQQNFTNFLVRRTTEHFESEFPKMNVVNSKETKKNLVSKEHEGFFLLNIFLSWGFKWKEAGASVKPLPCKRFLGRLFSGASPPPPLPTFCCLACQRMSPTKNMRNEFGRIHNLVPWKHEGEPKQY